MPNQRISKARKFAVETHPKRKQIDKELIEGHTINSVSNKYGISYKAVRGYRDKVLYPKVLEATQQRAEVTKSVAIETERKNITDAAELFNIILTAVDRMKKLSDACDEYLQDPDDVSKYLLDPHGHEITVIFHKKGKDGKRHKEKRTLSSVMERMEKDGYIIDSLTMSAADPRVMIVKASETLSRQMDTMVNAWKAIEDQRTNFSKAPEWRELTNVLEEILGRHPEERQIIADRLRSV